MRALLHSGTFRDALWIPSVSGLAAAATLSYALFATRLDAEYEPPAVTPERAAQDFMRAYRSRDYAGAARLAGGDLRRTLETRTRSVQLRATREPAVITAHWFVIEESFVVAKDKLRFDGVLAEEDTPDARGWPVSITVVQAGDHYLAEALHWPNGPPPDQR